MSGRRAPSVSSRLLTHHASRATRPAALCLCGALALFGCARPRPGEVGPKPHPITPPAAEAVDAAIQRGIAFLLTHQNKDGSWSSARRTKGMNTYMPVPGAHHANRAAITALCVSALIEVGGGNPAAEKALERGEAWLIEKLPLVRRADASAIYNVWTHAYGIEAFARMLGRPANATRREQLRALIRDQIRFLERYESVSGGWGYYDFGAHTQKPHSQPTSFTTATALIALHGAKELGIDPPDRLVQRALAVLRRQRNADFSYHYSDSHKWWPVVPINRPSGSLGRSQACNLALRLWGDPLVTDQVVRTWLDRLFARGGWLDMARKRPIPHESWAQIAGYFYLYGHYYAAFCIELLPPAEQPRFEAYLAHALLQVQDGDGSWWDYPDYDYHQAYGTAFALMTLHRCRSALHRGPL